jgi:hypothetical protein
MKNFSRLSLVTALSLLVAGPALGEPSKNNSVGVKETRTITVLPVDISRSLKITPIPTSQPIPLLIGTYWDCSDTPAGLEHCRLTLVVCTNDQSICTEL